MILCSMFTDWPCCLSSVDLQYKTIGINNKYVYQLVNFNWCLYFPTLALLDFSIIHFV